MISSHTSQSVIVLGGGGHGRVILSILKKMPNLRIIGYTDPVDHGCLLGAVWLGDDQRLKEIASGQSVMGILGIGLIHQTDVQRRQKLSEYLQSLQIEMPEIVSPTAIVNEGVYLGRGTVLMDGVVVNTGTTIDEVALLNTHCSIDHDCHIGQNSHVAPGVTLCGGVEIGAGCLIGAGVVVCPGCRIADYCTIGAGAVVTKDCIEPGTYVGIPARKRV